MYIIVISYKVKNICSYNHKNSIIYKLLKLLALLKLMLSSIIAEINQ
jgi:hypothetical protein